MIALIDAGRPHCHNQQSQNENHRRREFRLEAVVEWQQCQEPKKHCSAKDVTAWVSTNPFCPKWLSSVNQLAQREIAQE